MPFLGGQGANHGALSGMKQLRYIHFVELGQIYTALACGWARWTVNAKATRDEDFHVD